ncbi:MAG: TatD family hydrolase [Treponema sp.]|nr:TatD family hydrolase [Treponema sp.]
MTDAHCHPWDLSELEDGEPERRKHGVAAAASAWNLEQFEYHEGLARRAREEGAPPISCTFALHPQLSGMADSLAMPDPALLYDLAAQGRLGGVGETGFDLFEERYRQKEKLQEEWFRLHLETALTFDLPLVIHQRRALHKIFPHTGDLKRLRGVIFHSWHGTLGEAEALLRRGLNAYFSLGAGICNNHKKVMAFGALGDPGRFLLESDAPFQPLRGRAHSSYGDLKVICEKLGALRKEAGSPCADPGELEARIDENYFRIFPPP